MAATDFSLRTGAAQFLQTEKARGLISCCHLQKKSLSSVAYVLREQSSKQEGHHLLIHCRIAAALTPRETWDAMDFFSAGTMCFVRNSTQWSPFHTYAWVFVAPPATKGGKVWGDEKVVLTIRHWMISTVSNASHTSFATKMLIYYITFVYLLKICTWFIFTLRPHLLNFWWYRLLVQWNHKMLKRLTWSFTHHIFSCWLYIDPQGAIYKPFDVFPFRTSLSTSHSQSNTSPFWSALTHTVSARYLLTKWQ